MSNGFLAAEALKLPLCQRVQASGQALIVQQCQPIHIDINATKGNCGYFQPFYKNYTIGLDGYSLYPLTNCLWQQNIVNINGKHYVWKSESWTEVQPNIHRKNINLVSKFDEIIDNEFQYILHHHPAAAHQNFEQSNILQDMTGQMQDIATDSQRPSQVLEYKHRLPDLESKWPKFWKILAIPTILVLLFFICKWSYHIAKFCYSKEYRTFKLTKTLRQRSRAPRLIETTNEQVETNVANEPEPVYIEMANRGTSQRFDLLAPVIPSH